MTVFYKLKLSLNFTQITSVSINNTRDAMSYKQIVKKISTPFQLERLALKIIKISKNKYVAKTVTK